MVDPSGGLKQLSVIIPQLPAMQSWSPGGNSIQASNVHPPTQAPTVFGRRFLEEEATDVVVNLAPI